MGLMFVEGFITSLPKKMDSLAGDFFAHDFDILGKNNVITPEKAGFLHLFEHPLANKLSTYKPALYIKKVIYHRTPIQNIEQFL